MKTETMKQIKRLIYKICLNIYHNLEFTDEDIDLLCEAIDKLQPQQPTGEWKPPEDSPYDCSIKR